MSAETRLAKQGYQRRKWSRYKRNAQKFAASQRAKGSLARVIRQVGAYPGYVVVVKEPSRRKSSRKASRKRVSRNPVKHLILGDLALHGLSLLH